MTWPNLMWIGLALLCAVAACWGAAVHLRDVRRAKRSRWATWRDEPRDATNWVRQRDSDEDPI